MEKYGFLLCKSQTVAVSFHLAMAHSTRVPRPTAPTAECCPGSPQRQLQEEHQSQVRTQDSLQKEMVFNSTWQISEILFSNKSTFNKDKLVSRKRFSPAAVGELDRTRAAGPFQLSCSMHPSPAPNALTLPSHRRCSGQDSPSWM